MGSTENIYLDLHLKIRNLINLKSERDNVPFTASQLAHALGMPRSIINNLIHTDENKRVTNPRIDTLLKIVGFFKEDGFDISLDDLLGIKTSINIRAQSIKSASKVNVPVFSSFYKKEKIGSVEIDFSTSASNLFGFLASYDISPIFKKGSLIVIDPCAKIKKGNLVLLTLAGKKDWVIKKYNIFKHKVVLSSLNQDEKDIELLPTDTVSIHGVVIQINVKV